MILENLELSVDKKGNSSKVTHVIINSDFFNENIFISDIYKRFLIYVTIEELNKKFNLLLDHMKYVILRNKKFQLPDGRKIFNKFISLFTPISSINSIEEINENNYPIDDTFSITSDETKNIFIVLNLKLQQIEIKVKFTEQILFENICLFLNDDHVVIKHKGQVIRDFFLPIFLKYSNAKALLQNNILVINCPYEEFS